MVVSALIYASVALFALVVIGLWCLNLIGLPGNWMVVLVSILWIMVGPERWQFSWWVVIVLIVLAAIGELIEFAAAVAGTSKKGGSKRAATMAVIGSIIGGLLGAIVGLPIPVPLVGSLIGSILFACAGAFAGATLGEHWTGKTLEESIEIGKAAFVGRFLGTLGKLTMGSAMVGVAVLGPFFF